MVTCYITKSLGTMRGRQDTLLISTIMRKQTDTKQTNDNFTVDIQPYAVASPRVYETDGTETLNHNPLYVFDGPGDPDTEHIVTQTGDMYAQVQKPTKNGNLETEHSRTSSSGAQVVTTPSGDIYAVVNEPKKQTDDRKEKVAPEVEDGPSRYTNQEGLVYAEIDNTTDSDINTDVLL
ncbi:uncharacterized protein [Argopecten irradians]|uniref:uncharacterized protein n=1 Tax=Argopecten irradians TaxID=31199 RepID=UPI0037224E40